MVSAFLCLALIFMIFSSHSELELGQLLEHDDYLSDFAQSLKGSKVSFSFLSTFCFVFFVVVHFSCETTRCVMIISM